MLEAELFELLEGTTEAAWSVTERGEIRSWNAAAEQLFGYSAAEAIGKAVDTLLDARDALGTPALSGLDGTVPTRGRDGLVPNFDLDVRNRAGERLLVNVSTITFEGGRARRRLFVRLARDVTRHRLNDQLLVRAVEIGRALASLTADDVAHAPVETLTAQEIRILQLFAKGQAAAQIAERLRISPHTLRNHLHRINRKLRTHTRLEAVTHARRRGLID